MKIRTPNVVKQGLGSGYALRPASLSGLRVGFLDGWGSADGTAMFPAMSLIAERLRNEFGVTEVVWQKKPSISKAVPDALLRSFADQVDVVVNGEGLCGSCTAASMLDAINLEALGKPTVTIVGDRFESSARFHAKNLGMPDLYLYIESAPAEGSVQQYSTSDVDKNWELVETALTGQDLPAGNLPDAGKEVAPSAVGELAEPEEWNRLVEANGWSDGLPVAIPADRAVQEIIDYLGRDPQDVVALIPPTYGIASVEQIAVQCAMAGCKPEYAPVVLAALEALLEPEYNLHGTLCTTHPGAPQVIVSGPIVDELDFNTANSVHGGSGHANGAIGRAVRLIVRNIGGTDPRVNDMDPIGGGHKYAACVAERRDNPLGTINIDRGFSPDDSLVTVFSCPGPYPAVTNGRAERILALLCNGFTTATVQMFIAGGQALFTLSMKPARTLAEAGYTRDDIRRYLLEHAYLTPRGLKDAGVMQGPFTGIDQLYYGENSVQHLRIDVETAADDTRLPLFASIDDIQLLVTGGDTQFFSAFQPGWGGFGGKFVSKKIRR
ncbi:hypothetical protein G3I59_37495 [Amycolatopsis rubida]|uniref:UGSC-like domain-containing protein n=1 Tax=Amycolatopsis rubida TaxID=112413 RepID=A0ABX0C4F4_9PSEU|nr:MULTISPECIES: hypothetical protein [Amycolatopsis]MYW96152.1 hypothetical protein [Amycolatopsis rubida]NEC61143.1 hypothetical protein [Amycolatopsis rubida]OAP23333.1 hypothetical protein A4R44_05980 [Amycolatopsis sp. M39]